MIVTECMLAKRASIGIAEPLDTGQRCCGYVLNCRFKCLWFCYGFKCVVAAFLEVMWSNVHVFAKIDDSDYACMCSNAKASCEIN